MPCRGHRLGEAFDSLVGSAGSWGGADRAWVVQARCGSFPGVIKGLAPITVTKFLRAANRFLIRAV